MTSVFWYAVGNGIACGIWTLISIVLGAKYPQLIATWVGFVGCTSFFVAGAGKDGFIRSLASNYTGVLIGVTIIALGGFSANVYYNALVTGFFSFVIMYLIKFDLLKFGTCTFMGGFSAFATGGNWKLLLICLLLGQILGWSCDKLGGSLVKAFAKKEAKEDTV